MLTELSKGIFVDKFEIVRSLLMDDRSVRRFNGRAEVGYTIAANLIGLVRWCASGRNAQPLKYAVITAPEERALLYPALKWAGYYTDWDGPEPDERPTAYLVQYLDTEIAANCLCDDGLQLQAITLGATALGLGCCIIKSFNAETVKEVCGLAGNERFKPLYVVALGYPKEKVRVVDMPSGTDADFKYYRDADDTQVVPKRPVHDLLIHRGFKG